MTSGGGVLMLREDLERLPDEKLLHVQMHRPRPLDQFRRDEDLDAAMIDCDVGSQVLALEVGVDRHLSLAASSERWDEVERHRPAALLRKLQRFRR